MSTWRERLDRLSAAIEIARANTRPVLTPSDAEAVYRLLDEYRLAGAPGLDSEVPAPRTRARTPRGLKPSTCRVG